MVPNLIDGAASATDSDGFSMRLFQCSFNIGKSIGSCLGWGDASIGQELYIVSGLIRIYIVGH